jgi:hypothetical protein
MFLKLLTSISMLLTLTACSSLETETMPESKNIVGVTRFEMEDTNQWIQVFAWYPAESREDSVPLAYSEKWLNAVLAKQYGIPKFLMGGAQDSNSWLDAPILDGSFPVIIFNHGWQAFARSNMTQFEFLASKGFIVLSINHPQDSAVIQRNNGDFVHQSEAIKNAKRPTKEAIEDVAKLYKAIAETVTPLDYANKISALESNSIYATQKPNFQNWVQHTQWLLASVRNQNVNELPEWLAQAINPNHVGLLGHSFGGAVSGLVAHQTIDHLPAVVMDVAQLTYDAPINNMNPHVLYLNGTATKFGKVKISNQHLNQGWIVNNPNAQEINFTGAAHLNFTDLNHVSPMKWTGVLGPVNGKEFWQSLNNTVLTYFQREFQLME